MILLDTTVLVYAVGAEHPYREPCRALISAIESGVLVATTTTEVIQEFAHVRARRRTRTDAQHLSLAYADLLSPLLAVTEAQVRAGLGLWRRHTRLGAFDAVLAATAIDAQVTALVSSDRAFARVEALRHVLPDARAVQGLLA